MVPVLLPFPFVRFQMNNPVLQEHEKYNVYLSLKPTLKRNKMILALILKCEIKKVLKNAFPYGTFSFQNLL